MKYSSLYNEFLDLISVDNSELSSFIDENKVDSNDDLHIWFGLVVTPFVIKTIYDKNTNRIQKIFNFIEIALNENDNNIIEVIEFSLLEGLFSEFNSNIDIIKPFFGFETINSYNRIKKYLI